MKSFFILAAAILFTGCTTLKPPVAEYRLNADIPVSKGGFTKCTDRSVKISRPFAMSSLMSLDMRYSQSDDKIFSYSQSRWQEPPSDAVESLLLTCIRDSGIFKSALSPMSKSVGEFVLESDIEEFIQYFSTELKESYVHVKITLTLIDARTKEAIAARTFDIKSPVKTMDAKGAVEAYRISLSDILAQSIEWLRETCR